VVIAVMHELALVDRFCDRVVLLNNGRKVAEGPPGEVLTADRLRDVYRIVAPEPGRFDRFELSS
jgi:iron complex transport system ATP-binding protein